MFNKKSILITGGTGSFGKYFSNNFVPKNFHYNSKDNKDFLNVTQLRNILKKNFIF